MEPALIRQLALGILPPLIIAAVIFPLAWWRRRPDATAGPDAASPPTRESLRRDPTWLAPFLLGVLAMVMTPIINNRLPSFPPRSGVDWLPVVALAGLLLGVLARPLPLPIIPRWIGRALVTLAVGYVCLRTRIHAGTDAGGFSLAQTATWLGGYAGLTLAAWWALERTADRTRGPAAPAVLVIITFAANQLLVLGFHSLSLGQVPGVFAAALGPLAALALLRPRVTLAQGGVHVPVLVTSAALLLGYFFGHRDAAYPRAWVALLALAPMAALLAEVGPLRRFTGWKAWVLRAALAGVPAAAAVGWAAAHYEFPAEPEY